MYVKIVTLFMQLFKRKLNLSLAPAAGNVMALDLILTFTSMYYNQIFCVSRIRELLKEFFLEIYILQLFLK